MKKGLLITLVILAVVLIGGCGAYKSFQNGLNASHESLRTLYAKRALQDHHKVLQGSLFNSHTCTTRVLKLLEPYKVS